MGSHFEARGFPFCLFYNKGKSVGHGKACSYFPQHSLSFWFWPAIQILGLVRLVFPPEFTLTIIIIFGLDCLLP
jgi:hypothetical protein